MIQNYHTEFLTATILNWFHLLKDDTYKQIIVDSFQWLVNKKKCIINGFVIMPNHFHLIWKISDGFERKNVQGALFSFTAHEFKKKLKKNNTELLETHFVNKIDRDFQFWEREPMIKECWTKKFLQQKLNYTHFNPCQQHWNLADIPENYKYSSAKFYETGVKDFSFLTHFNDF
jgi:REP element-mobilizing transposase RayT